MSIQRHAVLNDTVYLYFAANDTSGSGADGATPLAHVRLGGAAAGAAPVYSPTPVLLTNAAYPAGAYEVAVSCSPANGFAEGSTYGVFCSLAVDGQNPTGFIGAITLAPIPANELAKAGSETAATNEALAWDDPAFAFNFTSKFNGSGYVGGAIKEKVDVSEDLVAAQPEDYAPTTGDMSIVQALYTIQQALVALGWSGTAGQALKRDKATPAFNVTNDNASNPTEVGGYTKA